MSSNSSPQPQLDDEQPLVDSSLAANIVLGSTRDVFDGLDQASLGSRIRSTFDNPNDGNDASDIQAVHSTEAGIGNPSHGKQTTVLTSAIPTCEIDEVEEPPKSQSDTDEEPPKYQNVTAEEPPRSQSNTNSRRQRDQDPTENRTGNPTVTTNQNHPNARRAEVQRLMKKWILWPIMALLLSFLLSIPLYLFHQHSLAVSDGDKQAIGGGMALQIVMWILAFLWQWAHTYFFGPAYGDAACGIQIIAALAVVGFMYYDFFVTGTGLPIVNSVLILELLVQALWNARENHRFTQNAIIARQDIELGRLEANEIRPTVAPQNPQP